MECPKCGDIEPSDHNESWWRCSCHQGTKKINLDEAMKNLDRFIAEEYFEDETT
jgi:hypothetical protein